MRRANQPFSSTNGQLRIVGDHLGSTTLVVDTASPPNVVQRQYSKPYGETAWQYDSFTTGGTSLTSIGYTGQRTDEDSTGLLFYKARTYDPILSFFTSGDTVSPGKADPKTRNRYGYVQNNPIKYVDPSGHEAENSSTSASGDSCDPSDPRPSAACKDKYDQLHEYGVRVTGLWTANELAWLLDAIHDILSATHWDAEAFRAAVGADPSAGQYLTFVRVHGPVDNTYGDKYPNLPTKNLVGRTWPGKGTISVYDLFGARENLAKRWIVHEIAHAIDFAQKGSGEGACAGTGWFSCGMAAYTQSKYTNGTYDPGGYRGKPASAWKSNELAEDFAESFTAMVYANNPSVLNADTNIPLHAPYANRQRYIGMIVGYFGEHRYR